MTIASPGKFYNSVNWGHENKIHSSMIVRVEELAVRLNDWLAGCLAGLLND